MRNAASIGDFRKLAKRRLPHFLFEYIDGGSYDEVTARRNSADLEAIALRQRVLRDVSAIDLSTEVLGQSLALPLVLAPVGLAGMNARRGETLAARAAAAAGVPFCLSTVSVCPLEEVRAASARPLWFQLYAIRDRGFLRDLLARAAAAGCKTLVFTVDMPVPGSRYRDVRSGLAGAPGLMGHSRRFLQALARPGWAWDVGLRGRPHALGNIAPLLGGRTGLEDFFAWMRANFDPSITWRELETIREAWPGEFVVKGILDAEDARSAIDHGADGIVVSNHGGRQLDGTPSTARALPAVAEAVGGRAAILVDGGIGSGLDVARMLALGADAVMVGRAWAFALAAGGREGVARMIELIAAELRVAMALTGATAIRELDRSCLVDP